MLLVKEEKEGIGLRMEGGFVEAVGFVVEEELWACELVGRSYSSIYTTSMQGFPSGS